MKKFTTDWETGDVLADGKVVGNVYEVSGVFVVADKGVAIAYGHEQIIVFDAGTGKQLQEEHTR